MMSVILITLHKTNPIMTQPIPTHKPRLLPYYADA